MVIVNDGDASLPSGPPAGSGGEVSMPASTTLTETDSNQAVSITLTRSSTSGAGTVTWTATEGTATEPEDYTPFDGVATFADGTSTATIDFTLVGDDTVEGSHTFTITLSNPVNMTINASAQSGTVTINDDDVPAASPPQLTALEMRDVDGDGKVDRIDARFDENLSSSCTGAWTLGGTVPSNGTAGSVAIVGNEARLTINEGAGNPDTAVGSLVVTIPAGAVCDTSATGNNAVGPMAPADFASPVFWNYEDQDTSGTADGRPETGDWLRLHVSEPILAGSVPATVNVSFSDPPGGGNDTMATAAILTSPTDLSGNGYVSGNNRTASFNSSAVALVSGGRAIEITLGTCSGSCSDLAQGISTNLQLTMSNTVVGTDGRNASGVVGKANYRLF
jgi:hypothetical protein